MSDGKPLRTKLIIFEIQYFYHEKLFIREKITRILQKLKKLTIIIQGQEYG